jgi:hypothetical protein
MQVRGVLAERGVVFERRTTMLRRGLVAWLETAAAGKVTESL